VAPSTAASKALGRASKHRPSKMALIVAVFVVGAVLSVAGSLIPWLLGYFIYRNTVKVWSQIYQNTYSPQYNHIETLLHQIAAAQGYHRQRLSEEVHQEFEALEEHFEALPAPEQRIARPNLNSLRQKVRRSRG
jgi:hypothetical protein